MIEQTQNKNITAFETEVLTLGKRAKKLALRLFIYLIISFLIVLVFFSSGLVMAFITCFSLMLCYIAFLEIKIYKLRKAQNPLETEEYKKVLKKIKWKTIGSAFLNIYLLGGFAIALHLIFEIKSARSGLEEMVLLSFIAALLVQNWIGFLIKYFIEKYTFQLQEKYLNSLKMPQ